jgi:hypothetical protein
MRQHGSKKPGQAQGEIRTEIVEHVLEDKEECELRDHDLPRRERHLPSAHAKGFSNGVEEEDLSGNSINEHNLKGQMACLRLALQR